MCSWLLVLLVLCETMQCFAQEKTVIDNVWVSQEMEPEKDAFEIHYTLNNVPKVFVLPKDTDYFEWEYETADAFCGDVDDDGINEIIVNVYFPNNFADSLCYTCIYRYKDKKWKQIFRYPEKDATDLSMVNFGARMEDGQLVWDIYANWKYLREY